MNERMCDLELEMLSPCFMGGAYQQPEFRIGSIRGLWRYWYRALYGNGFETSCSNEEDELFGATPGGEGLEPGKRGGGRGNARLILTAPLAADKPVPWTKSGQPTGADYLLFSMSMQKRKYLEPPSRVSLRLLVRGSESDFDRAARSLAAAFAFSGIGSRARRMAGAVHVASSLDRPPFFYSGPAPDPETLASRLRQLLVPVLTRPGRAPGRRPMYPVVADEFFSAGVLRKDFPGWREAMDTIGEGFRQFRQFEPGSSRRRRPDYDVAKGALQGQPPAPGQTITRAVFGLPIQFRFNSLGGQTAQAELTLESLPEGERRRRDRRGSPFFLTLDRLANDRIAVVWSVFRSALTPDGKIRIEQVQADQPDFSLLDDMLKRPEWQHHQIAG